MVTITSAQLSIASGARPGTVVVAVHGILDVAAAARLRSVLDAILQDREVVEVRVDLHAVCSVEVGGVSGLAAAAERAEERGAELTLGDPPHMLCRELESEGLARLIRTGRDDRPPPSTALEVHLRQARRQHPSNALSLVAGAGLGKAHGT